MTYSSPSGAAAHSQLPPNPSLGLLSNLAKRLQKSHEAREAEAIARLKSGHPRFKNATDEQVRDATVILRDAQLVIAREHGFENWAALKKHVLSLNAARAPEAALKSLMEAADRGELDRVRELLDQHPALVDARGGEGDRTALHRAAYKGHREIVELLLERGADPTIRDVGDNATALHFAAEKGDLHIVRLLIEHGADPDGFGDLHGVDVIGWATCFRPLHREVAEYLLKHGAQHNIFSAVAMGDIDAIKAMAKISRDVMDKPMAIWEERRRPLHLAVLKKQPKVIEVLLDLGADIEGTNIDDLTALDQAALKGEHECMDVLLKRGAKVGLPAAFVLARQDVIEKFLADDAEVLKPGHRWGRLIHIASGSASGSVIEALLANGAEVNSRDESRAFGTKGSTPLHDAAWGDNVQAIRVLVAHGAELNAKDQTYDATPLGWADYAGQKRAAEVLRELGAT